MHCTCPVSKPAAPRHIELVRRSTTRTPFARVTHFVDTEVVQSPRCRDLLGSWYQVHLRYGPRNIANSVDSRPARILRRHGCRTAARLLPLRASPYVLDHRCAACAQLLASGAPKTAVYVDVKTCACVYMLFCEALCDPIQFKSENSKLNTTRKTTLASHTGSSHGEAVSLGLTLSIDFIGRALPAPVPGAV